MINFIQKIFPSRCNVCQRKKEQAKDEQVEKLITCGVGHCPFQNYIEQAIREAQKAELLEFTLSKNEVLEGSYINITWRTKNCRSVSITNYGEVEHSGQKRIQLRRDTTEIEINLEDLFGETFESKKSVKVLLKPTFEIVELTDSILKGESFFIRYVATDFKSITLKDDLGNPISDLSKKKFYTSPPFNTDKKFFIQVVGAFGGELQKEIEIKVFEPPIINLFISDNNEKVDTLPIYFEFEYTNASKAELFCNDKLLADVTDSKRFTSISENKTETVLSPKFELVVTGLTGKPIKSELSNGISVYPQPSISEIRVSPDSIILFPKQITVSNRANFCEKIIFSEGKSETSINPNDSIHINPSENTTYSFKPIGKQNFHGQPKTLFIEVFHPIELEASASKKVTLPNVPVTISWESKNHTQILIEPGNIDITHKTSYPIKLETKTTIKVVAINKRDRKEFPLFVDVLAYPKVDIKIFGDLPKLDLQFPNIESIRPQVSLNELSKNLSAKEILPNNLSNRILKTIKDIFPKSDFNFNRTLREKMFTELKSIKRKQKSV